MAALQLFLSQLGFGGGLLFGVPLVVIGLTLRGLSRRHLARLVEARRHRRKIADLGEGPVTVAGIARRAADGRHVVEEARGGQVFFEPAEDVAVRSGDPVIVFGTASAEIARDAGYRTDARGWSIDARGDEALVLCGVASLGARIARLRAQALGGALVFAAGLLLVVACAAVSFLVGAAA